MSLSCVLAIRILISYFLKSKKLTFDLIVHMCQLSLITENQATEGFCKPQISDLYNLV